MCSYYIPCKEDKDDNREEAGYKEDEKEKEERKDRKKEEKNERMKQDSGMFLYHAHYAKGKKKTTPRRNGRGEGGEGEKK